MLCYCHSYSNVSRTDTWDSLFQFLISLETILSNEDVNVFLVTFSHKVADWDQTARSEPLWLPSHVLPFHPPWDLLLLRPPVQLWHSTAAAEVEAVMHQPLLCRGETNMTMSSWLYSKKGKRNNGRMAYPRPPDLSLQRQEEPPHTHTQIHICLCASIVKFVSN